MLKLKTELFDNFIKSLKKEDYICILHHTDGDGICSGVITKKALDKLGFKTVAFRTKHSDYWISEEAIEFIKNNKITKLITTDLAADQNVETLNKASKYCNILVIDHHKSYDKIKNEKVTTFKPYDCGIDMGQYCSTKLAFDMFSRYVDLSDLDWIAACGILCDYGHLTWKDFILNVLKKYNTEVKENLFKTELGMVNRLISYVEIYDENLVSELFDKLYTAKSYSDLLKGKLKEYMDIIEKEIDLWIKRFKREREDYGNFFFYEVKSKYKIGSVLSTIISELDLSKTFVILQCSDGKCSFNLRRNDGKGRLNDIAVESIKGLENVSAGGHKAAAGITVDDKSKLGIVKERLFENLKKEK